MRVTVSSKLIPAMVRLSVLILLSAWYGQAFAAEPVVALVGGTVIDGTGAAPRTRQTILIRGERIWRVGRSVRVPKGATVIDVTGKTVIPGLIDMHGHMYVRGAGAQRSQFEPYSLLYLAGGVTTVRSPGDFEPEGMVARRTSIEHDEAIGPRIFTAGPYFDHAPSQVDWIKGVSSPAEAVAKFNDWKDRINLVKFYTSITEPEFVAVLNAAHVAGLPATAHLGSIKAGRAIELGVDGLEHGLFGMPEFHPAPPSTQHRFCSIAELDLDSAPVNKLIDQIVAKRVAIDPTIVTYQSLHPGFEPVTSDWLRYFSPEAQAYQRKRLAAPSERDPVRDACLLRAVSKQIQFVGKVHDRGGIIVAGTDPVLVTLTPGYGLHRELKNLVAAGLTPIEAINAATLTAAKALRRDRDLGSIQAGKLADLVIVDGDPAKRIGDVGNTRIVFKGGFRYDPEALRKSAEGRIR